MQSRVDGNALTITVPAEDAGFFLSCNNYQFAGAIVNIALNRGAPNRGDARGAEKPKFSFDNAARNEFTKGKLFAILGRRYDSNTKVINLSNLASEPEMQEVGLERLSDPKLYRIFTVLIEEVMKSPKERNEGVTGLQLSGNKLQSLALMRTFTITFPELENLDLSANNITTLADMSPIRQFKNLRHLIITDNPILLSELTLTEVLTRWFPKLQLLNQDPITRPAKAQAAEPIPMPMVAPGVFKDIDGIGERFLKAFFPGFDSDRRRIVSEYYDKDSVFTMAVNNHALVDQSNKSQMRKNEWAEWIKGSRNLLKINHTSAQVNRTHQGKVAWRKQTRLIFQARKTSPRRSNRTRPRRTRRSRIRPNGSSRPCPSTACRTRRAPPRASRGSSSWCTARCLSTRARRG
jgi:nuclear RNA export factor